MSNDSLNDILLPLDERNLGQVLAAAAFAGLICRGPEAVPCESTCWWDERGFRLQTALSEANLFDTASSFLSSLRWIQGMGAAERGTFVAGSEVGSNPFISLTGDAPKSPFKTFSGQVSPEMLLKGQQAFAAPGETDSWLFQTICGVGSWGFDCRVGSHAYDLGFSSNDEGSGGLDPIYPVVELLGIAAASFFTAIQGWQSDESTVHYSIWARPISVSLAPFAFGCQLQGILARQYSVTHRGAAYGKGGAYRFFPEATLQSEEDHHHDRRIESRPWKGQGTARPIARGRSTQTGYRSQVTRRDSRH